ncbi:beta-galactoside alpha-2,6-sialyltransferase 2-like [Tachypleus tridentatus]|uniref:beta-galactoside alpha-2,6-sialyltransferase 2-like n=1 Tax=Tachypleus tridentatus TaxID=6853 RepID=UPI003FD1E2C7
MGRIIAVSIWMFIVMMILGVGGYIYVLWIQYWKFARSKHFSPSAAIRRSFLGNNLTSLSLKDIAQNLNLPSQNHLAVAANKAKKNDFAEEHTSLVDNLIKKINTYKHQLIVQLRKWQLQGASVISDQSQNHNNYKVHYKGQRSFGYKSETDLVCSAKHDVPVRMLSADDTFFKEIGLAPLFPNKNINQVLRMFNSCAIVSSSGSMYKSGLGKEIDTHDVVLRFNDAPTKGYEKDVGNKTTIRILNSQVVSKPEFDFSHSPLYENILLIVWDPPGYNDDIKKWYQHPDFDFFPFYWERRQRLPEENFFVVHPTVVWKAWNFIQENTAVLIKKNPPSSGFLGLLLLLQHCNTVDIYEYIPSMRLTKRCHYYDVHENLGCTLGDWHPLASEKLLSLAMNTASDIQVFVKGKITIKADVKC